MPEIIDVPSGGPDPNDASEIAVLDLDTFLARASHIARVPHRINFYQMLLITCGQGRHWIDFEPHSYQPNSLFMVGKGQIQEYDLTPGTTGYLILFSEQHLYHSTSDFEWMFSLALFNSQLEPMGITLPTNIYNEFLTMISYIQAELRSDPDLVRSDILSNFLKILIFKAERLKQSQHHLHEKGMHQNYELFIRFRGLLETDYTKSRNVQEYAAALTIMPKKLNKITRLYLGRTAKQVIDERVVLEIKRLLSYSDLSTQEIAHNLGFSDPANMVKFFKRYANVTPIQFRCSFEKTHIDKV